MASLSTGQVLIGFLVIILAYGIYSVYTLKDKIHCTFIREDKTIVAKFAKVKMQKIDWENKWYNLDPKRTVLKLVWMGIIPTYVRCLIFKWDSNMPLDPTTWSNAYDNPADRKALDRTENLRSLLINTKTSVGMKSNQKKGMLEGLVPIILICGFLILGYFGYQSIKKLDLIGIGQNVIQEQNIQLQKDLDLIKNK